MRQRIFCIALYVGILAFVGWAGRRRHVFALSGVSGGRLDASDAFLVVDVDQ